MENDSVVSDTTAVVVDPFQAPGILTDTSDGWFFWPGQLYADTLVLAKCNNDVINAGFDLLRFKADGAVQLEDCDTRPRCGNGMLHFDSTSSWKLKKDRLILALTYGYGGMPGNYRSKIEYRVDSSIPGKRLLIRQRTVYYEEPKHEFPYVLP